MVLLRHLSYNRPLQTVFRCNRHSDRTLEAPNGPPEYCQDGTVTHLSYNRLLETLFRYNRNSDRTLEAPKESNFPPRLKVAGLE